MVNVMRSIAEEWREAEDGYHFRLGAIRFQFVIASPRPLDRDVTRSNSVAPWRRKSPLVVA